MPYSMASIAGAKEHALECEAIGRQAWVEGLGLGTRGVRRSGQLDSYSKALEQYRLGLSHLDGAAGLEEDSEAVELLSRLHAACAQVYLAQQVPFRAMMEAKAALGWTPSLAQAHIFYGSAVLSMERAQEMFYDDAQEREQILMEVQHGLHMVLQHEPAHREAAKDLKYCEKLLRDGSSAKAPDDVPKAPEFRRRSLQAPHRLVRAPRCAGVRAAGGGQFGGRVRCSVEPETMPKAAHNETCGLEAAMLSTAPSSSQVMCRSRSASFMCTY
eukprot:3465660-Amphidinium_carterae.1